jgi:osmotically-inducible protein OsmY
MNTLRSLAVVVVLTTAFAATGCNVFRGESTPGQYVDDVAITSKVKAKLLDSDNVDGLDVNVDSTNGRVTLSGWASSSAESRTATTLAASVKGVKSVDNQLKIKN